MYRKINWYRGCDRPSENKIFQTLFTTQREGVPYPSLSPLCTDVLESTDKISLDTVCENHLET